MPSDDASDKVADDARASALGMWVEGQSTSQGLSLELSGPFEAAGQDTEWGLRIEGENQAGELLLFRGGLVMIHSFSKSAPAAEMEFHHVDDVTEERLMTMLDELAARA
ncbi:MAG TPA: hypothetical protein VNI34_05880 [Candidatus Nitrosotalea sp.]|nr:hypothetical protein [Candidatus Nitrosotalea sp.]